MVVKMTLDQAVSAPEALLRRRNCLLRKVRVQYRCVETAVDLMAEDEYTRRKACWQHYLTHFPVYCRWAAGKHLVDPTFHSFDSGGQAEGLVAEALIGFIHAVIAHRFDAHRALPCTYIKRAIRNQAQDVLRRGIQPTPRECLGCWESHNGLCPHFASEHPWEDVVRQCYNPPIVVGLEEHEEFDEAESTFAVAGLQDQWPPIWDKGGTAFSYSRPVEEEALSVVTYELLERLMLEILNHDQMTVLVETMRNHKTSREIALLIDTTPGNVDQLRRRALQKLYYALTQ
jgi:RNA polymerase sigma factor (sigma-70 family)